MDEASYRTLMSYNGGMKKLGDVYRVAAKQCNLPECAFWILYTLRLEQTTFTQTEICDFLREPKQTVNSALKKLEAGGYIALLPGDDQRSKRVCLTPSGLRLAEQTVDRVAAAESDALSRLSPPDRAAFIRLIKRYADLFEEQIAQI